MKHLLDVNLLIAGFVRTNSLHGRAHAWLDGKQVVLCPIVELGFLRISTNRKSAIGLTMHEARKVLERFASERKVERISDDLPALESHARESDEVTDHYLANLAAKHGCRLATFDSDLKHSSADLIS